MTIYNCACDAAYPKSTLLALRTRLMRRTGFSAQASNPPPGMAELMNDFLIQAQRLAYLEWTTFQRKRWFTWDLVAGERFYDYADGDDEDATCTKRLDMLKIDFVGVSDENGGWTPLARGIDPSMYSDANQAGWPSRFELGQCIEVWPEPEAGTTSKLRVHGEFGLLSFAADGDYTTIDDEVVFLRALTNAKAHYGHADAGNYRGQEELRVMNIVAASHVGHRYVPPDMPGYRIADGLRGVVTPWGVIYNELDNALAV